MKFSLPLLMRRVNVEYQAALLWLAVYVVVSTTGHRFDARYLGYGWQLIPWDILSSDPWRSLWYLHVQPPLWNAALGISAWVSPASDALTLQILMAGFGAVLAGASATLGFRLGLTRRSAVIVALIATANPEVLKGAFEPTYELAVAALLVVLGAIVIGPVDDGETLISIRRRVILVAVVVTVIALTRSLYHPLWVAAVVVLMLWTYRQQFNRRFMLAVVMIPVIGIGSWMGKNEILYDRPTLSSWFGMNLQRAVIPVLDLDDLEEMHRRGLVSDIAMIGPFGNYGLYADAVDECRPSHSHRSVVEATRTTDQWSPNFNYECFLPIFDQAGQDAWAVIKEHPGVWLQGRMWSVRTTFAVSTMPAESPSIVMRGLDSVFSWARLDFGGVLSTKGWGTPIFGQLEAPVDFGLLLIPVYASVIGFGLLQLRSIRWRRRGESAVVPSSDERRALLFLYVSGTVLFTIVVGAVAELGEQARFRSMTDPLVVVVALTLVVPKVKSHFKSRRQRSTAEPL